MEKAPTPPGVGASIKGGGQENELERTLPILYYQIVLCTGRKRFEENDNIIHSTDVVLMWMSSHENVYFANTLAF